MHAVLSAVPILAVLAVSAMAQSAPSAQIDRALGRWELSNPSGTRKCAVTFRPERAGQGHALSIDPQCAQAFPAVQAVGAWPVAPNGNIRWLDQGGAVAFDFGETEVGIFEALRPGDPNVYFLTNLGLAGTQLPSADEVTGPWTIGQPRGRPLCTITLSPELAGDAGPLEQRYRLEVATGCERSLAALRLMSWRLERELLILIGQDRSSLSFRRETGGNRWLKVPPDNRPLTLTRD